MGLIEEISFEVRAPSRFHRFMQGLVASRPGAWLFQRTLYVVDKAVATATRGRLTFAGLAAAVPTIFLTTTGAKTGMERTSPLLGIPHGGDLAVIGTNYGQRPTPGWVYNLEADPSAVVSFDGRAAKVVARKAGPDELEEVFRAADDVYVGYGKYRSRVTHREIRVFILESPTDD